MKTSKTLLKEICSFTLLPKVYCHHCVHDRLFTVAEAKKKLTGDVSGFKGGPLVVWETPVRTRPNFRAGHTTDY